jgi:hypothetical protein
MALLPAWFVLGVVRPGLLPRWFPSAARTTIVVMAVVALASFATFYAIRAPAVEEGAAQSQSWDPGEFYGPIAPMAHSPEQPFVEHISIDTGSVYRGADRVTWSLEGRLAASVPLAGWTDLHLEVWPSRIGSSGPSAPMDHAIASGGITVTGRHFSGAVTFLPQPDADGYYVALVGKDPSGVRMQLGWPQWEQWTWTGSVWQYLSTQFATGS